MEARNHQSAGQRSIDVDCRGMQCPAPILQVAKTVRQVVDQPALLHVFSDDSDFPADLEAWCRAANAQLRWSSAPEPGVYHGVVAVHGAQFPATNGGGRGVPRAQPEPRPAPAPAPAARPAPPPRPASPPRPAAPPRPASSPRSAPRAAAPAMVSQAVSEPGVRPITAASSGGLTAFPTLNLQGYASPVAILTLTETLRASPQGVRVTSDDPEFRTALHAWSAAVRAQVRDVQQWEHGWSAIVVLPHEVVSAMPPAATSAPVMTSQPQLPAVVQGPPRENLATLLVLHNDLEVLLGAMMTANACAASGMDVVVFFSFWGVNVLRGPNPGVKPEPKGILQRVMQWMMPRGPRRQRLGKMDMGGMGTAMMQTFMRQQNVLTLEQQMRESIDLGVRFQVCTMSMSVMGIQKSDLMDLPNMEFLGVTSFAESARKSALSLVF